MTTRFIGLKELRMNMARITAEAVKKKQRLIVLRKNVPLFELRPLSKKDAEIERLLLAVKEGREDLAAGKTYSLEQMEKRLGL